MFNFTDTLDYTCERGSKFVDEEERPREVLLCDEGDWVGNLTSCVVSKYPTNEGGQKKRLPSDKR